MTKLLIVHDDMLMRLLIRHFVMADSQMQLVGEAENGQMAVKMAEVLRPDMIVMTSYSSVMDGVTTTRTIMESYPQTLIIVISQFLYSDEIKQSLDMLDAGAVDIITTSSSHLRLDITGIKTDLLEKIKMWGQCPAGELGRKKKIHREFLKGIRQSLPKM